MPSGRFDGSRTLEAGGEHAQPADQSWNSKKGSVSFRLVRHPTTKPQHNTTNLHVSGAGGKSAKPALER